MRSVLTFLAGAAGAFLLPVCPYAALSTVLAVVEGASAWSLRRRSGVAQVLPGSLRLRVAIAGVVRIYVALLVAHGADVVFGVGCCLRFTGAAVCFQQAMAILENESAAGGPAWAARLRRYLQDKLGGA